MQQGSALSAMRYSGKQVWYRRWNCVKVTEAKPLRGGMLLVTFSTGEKRLSDTTMKRYLTSALSDSIIRHYIDIKKQKKGISAMQNRNKFPKQNRYSVVPVYHWNQGLLFDGNHTVLRNPNHLIRMITYEIKH